MSESVLTQKKAMVNMRTFAMVQTVKIGSPFHFKVYLEVRPETMELDTGSASSVMSEGVY